MNPKNIASPFIVYLRYLFFKKMMLEGYEYKLNFASVEISFSGNIAWLCIILPLQAGKFPFIQVCPRVRCIPKSESFFYPFLSPPLVIFIVTLAFSIAIILLPEAVFISVCIGFKTKYIILCQIYDKCVNMLIKCYLYCPPQFYINLF